MKLNCLISSETPWLSKGANYSGPSSQDNKMYGLSPDVHKNKPIQIAKGKKAITDYTRAVGDSKGILELMLYFVEKEANFTASYGDIDAGFYLALERMYDNALDLLLTMDDQTIAEYRDRFEAVVTSTSGIGWGFHDKLGQ